MPYIGPPAPDRFVAPKAAKQFSGDGSTTAFTLDHAVGSDEDILVSVDGVIQEPSVAYAVSNGTTLTFTAAPSNNSGNNIFVYYLFRTVGTVSHPSNNAFTATNGTLTGTLDVTGASTLTGALSAKGGAVFNEDSADVDFRVEGNGDANALFVEGETDNVGVGTNDPADKFHAYLASGQRVARFEANSSTSAHISFKANNTSLMPTVGVKDEDLYFSTGDAVERMRVAGSTGLVTIGKTTGSFATAGTALYQNGEVNFTHDNTTVVYINRLTSDGNLVSFHQAGTAEGTISISGTTTSYNGGHLSRWSRLLNNSKDETIVKGTVMTNLDEMVEWGDEDNEQLNKMAVSSVEGDANVAGVFVNWDNDDDWNDMNIAMTGDMVIRIAKGTTVARGDLLMSAGDGTAKPQGDDIVRSKTIAKVTSTNVSHTYDDGTYLVPCVLMAC